MSAGRIIGVRESFIDSLGDQAVLELREFVVYTLCTLFPSHAFSMLFGLRVAEDVLAGEAPGLADIQEALDRRRKGGNGEQPDE